MRLGVALSLALRMVPAYLVDMAHGHEILITFGAAAAIGGWLMVLAHRLHVPAIPLLLLAGVGLGESGVGLLKPHALGDGLGVVVQLAVGLILFEGGLNLYPDDFRRAPGEIRSLLTRGVVITWGGATALVHLFFDLPWAMCALAGSLVIVTGPTVVAPILKRVHVRKRIASVLHWESVLIDPVGVFLALLTFEWISSGGDNALVEFGLRVAAGGAFGFAGGRLLQAAVLRGLVPTAQVNVSAVAAAVGIFTASSGVVSESGLLAVTIAGYVLGRADLPSVDRLRVFKEELVDLLIGLLFLLLAAGLDVGAFIESGPALLGLVACVMLLVRPLSVLVSTWGYGLGKRERVFLSWMAPRGIVAASMASLFALELADHPVWGSHAAFLETFTYAVIAGTVVVQGSTAGLVARALSVTLEKPTDWLIVGAHSVGRATARMIIERGQEVTVIDTNGSDVAASRAEGLQVIWGNALTIDTERHIDLQSVGNVLVVTPNEDLNVRIARHLRDELPEASMQLWVSSEFTRERLPGERTFDDLDLPALITGRDEGALGVHTRPEWVIVSTATDFVGLLREMLGLLATRLPTLAPDELIEGLTDPASSVTLGHDGVVVTHVRVPELTDPVVAAARLAEPVMRDGQEVRVAFLVLSPEERAESHLQALASVASFVLHHLSPEALERPPDAEAWVDVFFPRPAG